MTEPYNEGLRDGERYATSGFPVDPVCYNLWEEPGENPVSQAAEGIDLGLESVGVARAVAHLAVAASVFEGAVLMLMASIACTRHFYYPTELLPPRDYEAFSELLGTLSDPVSVELFLGGGIDMSSQNCSLRMTRVYKSADGARAEIIGMGRIASYFICCVRTDQSGSLKVIENHVAL
jgi:hypothetical protein